MENTTKALVIARSILIGILILTLATYLYSSLSTTANEIREQVELKRIVQYNTKFENLSGNYEDDPYATTVYQLMQAYADILDNNTFYVRTSSDFPYEGTQLIIRGTSSANGTYCNFIGEANDRGVFSTIPNDAIDNLLQEMLEVSEAKTNEDKLKYGFNVQLETNTENGKVKTVIFTKGNRK